MSICSIYGVLTTCGFCCACVHKKPEIIAVVIICTRIIWLIIGPIILTSLDKISKAIESNLSIVGEFEVINDCADDYA